ncbi:DUF2273 domain-containing protein [Streptococcus pneumoniae]|nr:DUF2273 domain-containing protein [Streptococcus pneumoniae]MTV35428.1 DUF2273 domain-containing protein [Streptococcus pneumoniae]
MEWLKQYRYPIIAGLIGVFLACLIVSFGFFKTIFVLILGQNKKTVSRVK